MVIRWKDCWNDCVCGTAAYARRPGIISGWGLGGRFYPVLYLLTRMGGSPGLGHWLAAEKQLLGKMSRLEVHHIFRRALIQGKVRTRRSQCPGKFIFLTKDTNLKISDTLPEQYFPEIEANHLGALASQWIPMDPKYSGRCRTTVNSSLLGESCLPLKLIAGC